MKIILADNLRMLRQKGGYSQEAVAEIIDVSKQAVAKWEMGESLQQTTHVETVCLLSKLSWAKNAIDVKVDMDELDVTSAETKATYEEIKAYVPENSGLQVSSFFYQSMQEKLRYQNSVITDMI